MGVCGCIIPDPNCGCRSVKSPYGLAGHAAEIIRLEAEIERLREALKNTRTVMRQAFNRIHCLPRTSDTDLANEIDATLGKIRKALREKE